MALLYTRFIKFISSHMLGQWSYDLLTDTSSEEVMWTNVAGWRGLMHLALCLTNCIKVVHDYKWTPGGILLQDRLRPEYTLYISFPGREGWRNLPRIQIKLFVAVCLQRRTYCVYYTIHVWGTLTIVSLQCIAELQ